MAQVPHPRGQEPNPSDKHRVLDEVPRQGARLVLAASVAPERPNFDDIVVKLRKHLPHREQRDTDAFNISEVDSVIDTALDKLAERKSEVESGLGVAIPLGVSRGKQLFEAAATYLTSSLHAPVTLHTEEEYINTMHDTTDTIEHFPLADYGFHGYLDPANVAQFLQTTYGGAKMAWVQQTNGKDELYLPTDSGVWLDIQVDAPPLTLASLDGADVSAEQHAPEIFLVVPSVGQ